MVKLALDSYYAYRLRGGQTQKVKVIGMLSTDLKYFASSNVPHHKLMILVEFRDGEQKWVSHKEIIRSWDRQKKYLSYELPLSIDNSILNEWSKMRAIPYQIKTKEYKYYSGEDVELCFPNASEAWFATKLEKCGLMWNYEPHVFDVEGETVCPDFYLPQLDMYFEICIGSSKHADQTKRRKKRKLKKTHKSVHMGIVLRKQILNLAKLDGKDFIDYLKALK